MPIPASGIVRPVLMSVAVILTLIAMGMGSMSFASQGATQDADPSTTLDNDPQARPKLPEQAHPLPLVRQETSYSCGAAALLSVLKYWTTYRGSEKQLYPLLGTTPSDGTHPRALERVAREFGLEAQLREGLQFEDVLSAMRRGETVILDIQAWPEDDELEWSERWEDGHYVVFMGSDHQYAYVMDPSTDDAYAYLPIPELMERWHDYETELGKRREYLNSGIFVRGAVPQATELDTRRLLRLQ